LWTIPCTLYAPLVGRIYPAYVRSCSLHGRLSIHVIKGAHLTVCPINKTGRSYGTSISAQHPADGAQNGARRTRANARTASSSPRGPNVVRIGWNCLLLWRSRFSVCKRIGGCFGGCWFEDSLRFGAADRIKRICNYLIPLPAAAVCVSVHELGTDFQSDGCKPTLPLDETPTSSARACQSRG
jgi:hypothetical protein